MFDMSSASGYVGETYVQEFGTRFLVRPQWSPHHLNANCYIYSKNTWRISRCIPLSKLIPHSVLPLSWSKNISALCQEYMLLCDLPLSSQPRLRLLRHAEHWPPEYSMANRKLHVLLAEDGYIYYLHVINWKLCLQIVFSEIWTQCF